MYAFCPGYLGFVLVSARSKRSRATELHYQGAQVFLKRPRSSPAVLNSLSAHRRRARSPHCARAGGNCCWARLAVCRRVPQPRFRSLPGRGAEAGGSSAFPFLEAVVMHLPVCASRFRGNGPAQRGQPRPAGWWWAQRPAAGTTRRCLESPRRCAAFYIMFALFLNLSACAVSLLRYFARRR